MALHTAGDLSVVEFRATLDALGVTQNRAGQWFGVNSRSIRRWQYGERRIPRGVAIVIHLLSAGVVTAVQVEEAAAAIPARVELEPEAEQSALVCAETATLADPGLTTAQKVLRLVERACRWPINDPGHPNFRFCGRATVREPYCEAHRAAAYVAQRELNELPPGLGSPALGEHSRQPQASAARRMLRAVH
jgi:hypothetical protein